MVILTFIIADYIMNFLFELIDHINPRVRVCFIVLAGYCNDAIVDNDLPIIVL